MVTGIAVLVCITTAVDSTPFEFTPPKKSYTTQIVVNGVLSLGLGTVSYFFHTKGNQAYEEYQASATMKDAVDNWHRVTTFDAYRNLCIAGTAVFFTRMVYYYLKSKRPHATSLVPRIDYDHARAKFVMAIEKHL